MENKNLRIKRTKGRPPYIANIKQLQELYTKIANNEITNSDGWKMARLQEDKMV